jgi:hypothetical protein
MSWLALVNNKLHVSRAGDLIICEESHVRSEFFAPVGPFVQCWVAATRTTLAKAQITVAANAHARAVQIMVDELVLNKELTLLAAMSDQHVQAAFTSKVKELAVDPALRAELAQFVIVAPIVAAGRNVDEVPRTVDNWLEDSRASIGHLFFDAMLVAVNSKFTRADFNLQERQHAYSLYTRSLNTGDLTAALTMRVYVPLWIKEFRLALDFAPPLPNINAAAFAAAEERYVTRLRVALFGHLESVVDIATMSNQRLAAGMPRFGADVNTRLKFDAMVVQLEASWDMQRQQVQHLASMRSSAISAARSVAAVQPLPPVATTRQAVASVGRPSLKQDPLERAQSRDRSRSRSQSRTRPQNAIERRRAERIANGDWSEDHPRGTNRGVCSMMVDGEPCGSEEHCKYDCPEYKCFGCEQHAPGHARDFCPSGPAPRRDF